VTRRAAVPTPTDEATRVLDGGFWLVLVLAVACGVLLVAAVVRGSASPDADASGAVGATASPSASLDPAAFLDPDPRTAPPIELTAPDGQPFSLASLRGSPTFVFFGYTHCPDVCPATIGTIGEVLAANDVGARAVFVTIDPDRDTTTWLTEYARYLPAGFVALTGTAGEIAQTAKAWDVQYAKVDEGDPNGYGMSHTATVRLVDASGTVRATFPFGTTRDEMAAALRLVVARSASSPRPTAPAAAPSEDVAATPAPSVASNDVAGDLAVAVVSTSVWAGPPSPIILTLSRHGERVNEIALRPTVQLRSPAGDPIGAPVAAVAVQPPGEDTVSYVASPAIPTPGPWSLSVSVTMPDGSVEGTVDVRALDPGTIPSIGGAAPTVHTPTLGDVGGLAKTITTDPAPDLRLSTTSTTDALAAGRPFVLVIDSTKFRVSPACGRAVIMARFALDRWPGVSFIHLEPYRYSVVTDTPVLDGTLDDPTLTDPAAGWGIGGAPWGARSMPWAFVVDGHGIVRAAYQGVMGSDDIDVIVSMIMAGG
jgi:protein SCO1